MFGVIVGVLVAVLFLLLSFKVDTSGERPRTVLRSPALLILGIGITIFSAAFANRCFLTVPAAYVATVYDPLRGGVQPVELPEGFHFVLPWWKTELWRVQTQEYTMSAIRSEGAVIGDDSIHCQTNEGLGLNLDVTVLFHIDPKEAHALWQKIGEDYQQVLVRPYARNVIRMVVAKYSVVDVYGVKRQQIEQEITEAMRQAFAEKGIALESVLLRNVEFANPEFARAITEKQVAEQQIRTEEQNLRRAQIEKRTMVAQAKGEAEAIQRRGETLRQNPEVVQYELVQKIAPNVRALYLPPNYLPVSPRTGGR
ncbi:MAG: prohibitin family protein [Armatimonadota bacterium]|nr:prohibitin family protein [bacterium]MDW8320262.1 prohibitin family protein [Armatimonadota bacterium]